MKYVVNTLKGYILSYSDTECIVTALLKEAAHFTKDGAEEVQDKLFKVYNLTSYKAPI